MNATQQLHAMGQSLWLDNITRGLLTSGTLSRYIEELAVTGLTSNPTIFDNAIKNADFYDDAIRKKALAGKSGEALFFELALEDLIQAADLFRPLHQTTGGIDGWVSLEISPLLANATAGTIKAAAKLHARAQDTLYVEALAAPNTINTLPEETLRAFAEHGRVKDAMPIDGGDAEEMLAAFAYEGVNDMDIAVELQREGTEAFARSWSDLMSRIASKIEALTHAGQV